MPDIAVGILETQRIQVRMSSTSNASPVSCAGATSQGTNTVSLPWWVKVFAEGAKQICKYVWELILAFFDGKRDDHEGPPQEPSPEKPTDPSIDALPTYQMKTNPRGIGIIINNKVFTNLEQRKGTDKDATDLEKLFVHLGFCTSRHDNLTASQMREVLAYVAAIDHKNYDCLLVAILTHGGDQGRMYGTDGNIDGSNCISVEDITKLLNGHGCPSLVDKPKIFFLQLCRGSKTDYGVEINRSSVNQKVTSKDQTDTAEGAQKEENDSDHVTIGTIPSEADFLFAYATIPGFVSWRNHENGSYFISTLVQVFYELANKEHLMDMLTEVNRRVGEFEIIYEKVIQKQTPEPTSRLHKKLYFFPEKRFPEKRPN